MNRRYYYLDSEGTLQGPFWLSQMREFVEYGRLHGRVEVCVQGEREWSPLSSFPELTMQRNELEEALHQGTAAATMNHYERRMWRWLMVLLALYAIYAYLNYR